MTNALRWGIIGTGTISHSLVADLKTVTGSTVVAVWGRTAGRAREFAGKYGIPFATDDLDAFLARTDIDAVYIATPTGTHLPIALDSLTAGKHVLVEKPMAESLAGVEAIFERARQVGRFAMEAMWMKFNPMHLEIHRRMAEGGLGEVRSVRAGFGMPFPSGGSRWIAELGGSTVLDQGIYPVTLAMTALGEPTAVSARGVVRDGVDVAAHITLEFAGDRFAHLACSMVEFVQPSASVSGTGGWVDLDAMFWAGTSASWHAGDARAIFQEPERIEPAKEGNGYTPMLRSVTAKILQGDLEHPSHDRTATCSVARVLDEIRGQLGIAVRGQTEA